MQWQVLLELFAGWFPRIMRSPHYPCFLDFAIITDCNVDRLILFVQTLWACLCIIRATQVFLRLLWRAYGRQL